METEALSQKERKKMMFDIRKSRQLLKNLQLFSVLVILLGASSIISSLFIVNHDTKNIVLGIGIALMPIGLISYIYYTSLSHNLMHEIRSMISPPVESLIREIKASNDFLCDCEKLGIVGVYPNRYEAIRNFKEHLMNEKEEVKVAGLSLKSLLDTPDLSIPHIIRDGMIEGCSWKFLLTHLDFAKQREIFETRPKGTIINETKEVLSILENIGVPESNIKFYKGPPSCFLLITSKRMLINPYPPEDSAFKNFCLEAKKTQNTSDIYHQCLDIYFQKIWDGANSVAYTEKL
jgi:predicted DNA-binding transcriptional regulator